MLKMLKINTSGKRHTTDTKLVRRIACEDKFATLQRLKTSISGLQTKDARQRLAKNGPNEIVNKPKNTRLQFLCEAFMTPFTSILLQYVQWHDLVMEELSYLSA